MDGQTEGLKYIVKPTGAFCDSADVRSNLRSVAEGVWSTRLCYKTVRATFLGLLRWVLPWRLWLVEGFSQRGEGGGGCAGLDTVLFFAGFVADEVAQGPVPLLRTSAFPAINILLILQVIWSSPLDSLAVRWTYLLGI